MNTDSVRNDQCNNSATVINIDVTDIVLTPLTCASIVNEIIKNILYQKSQIPYPFIWLKSIVNKKRRSLEENSADQNKKITLYKHFQLVSSTYDSLENIMTSISNHFSHLHNKLKELIFVMGVTPFCAEEVFRIKVSSLAHGHHEKNHVDLNSRHQPKILRNIFLSQTWMRFLDNSVPCTNTYIFMVIQGDSTSSYCDDNFFVSKPLILPSRTKQTTVYLNYIDPHMCSCCESLEIFQDFCDSESSREVHNDVDHTNYRGEIEEIWLQSKIIVQGFKDRFINKISVCEMW